MSNENYKQLEVDPRDVLGRGSFGVVFKGLWQVFAPPVTLLPPAQYAPAPPLTPVAAPGMLSTGTFSG